MVVQLVVWPIVGLVGNRSEFGDLAYVVLWLRLFSNSGVGCLARRDAPAGFSPFSPQQGLSPLHDGIRERWRINVQPRLPHSRYRKTSVDLTVVVDHADRVRAAYAAFGHSPPSPLSDTSNPTYSSIAALRLFPCTRPGLCRRCYIADRRDLLGMPMRQGDCGDDGWPDRCARRTRDRTRARCRPTTLL